jgi:hypothetical protein
MTNEPLQYVHLNPIPVWELAREVICRVKRLRVSQASNSSLVMNSAPHRA